MGRAKETFGKKETIKKKFQKKQDKEHKKELRKSNSDKGKSLEDMMVYVDENGNISNTPPDPKKMRAMNTSEIQISIPKQQDFEAEETVRSGRVTFFNDAKGYGFIKDLKTQESIFVHSNGVTNPIKDNDLVNFEIEMGQKGPVAVKVTKVVQ